jgi:hypothetical protein
LAAQFLVQVHVRRRLLVLGAAYTRLGQAVGQTPPDGYQQWPTETAAGCGEVASTCASLRRPSLLALIPVIVTLAAKASHFHTRSSWLLIVLVYAAAFGVMVLLAFLFGFALKRRYLLTPLDQTPEASSTYRSEDELFWLLGRRKPLEYPLDLVVGMFLALVLGEALLLTAALEPSWIGRHLSFFIPAAIALAAILFVLFGWVGRATRARRGSR